MMTELTKSICLETVLTDARKWYKKLYPRKYARNPNTAKHMKAALKRELDAIFAAQNEEWNQQLMAWYEQAVLRYGGKLEVLPWQS